MAGFFFNNDLSNSFGGGGYGTAGPDPYEAYDEYRQRRQLESDRQYELQVQAAKRQREQMAISRGQAEATRWYNEQMIKLSKAKFEEDKRQFDMTFGENQRQFNTTFGENQRQFNTNASGYLDGKPTLQREQFFDNSLQGWTNKAIDLGSRPADWVRYKQYTTGVNNNIGSIPGLSWASAGNQVGNTTAQGEHPTGSLGNVFGAMGVNAGQGGGSGGASGDWASQAAQQANAIATAPLNLTPGEQQIYQTANEFSRQPNQAAPGWLESLDPLTVSLLEGAAQSQGHDWSTVMSRYRRSRWGGGGSASAA
jgi:hypothetical protein